MIPLEKYTKAEIIAAIRYRTRYDINSEISIQKICAQKRIEINHAKWEAAQRECEVAGERWRNYNKQLCGKYGGSFRLSDLSESEMNELCRLATVSQNADRKEKEAYEKLEQNWNKAKEETG